MDYDVIRQIVIETVREMIAQGAARPFRKSMKAAPSDVEMCLTKWFDGNAPGHVMASDLGVLLRATVGCPVPPNSYGIVMKRLGFRSNVRHIDGKPQRMWQRGRFPSSRFVLGRDAEGRLDLRQPAPPAAPPPLPY